MGEESESVCDEDRYYVSGAPTVFGVLLTWSKLRRHVMEIFINDFKSEAKLSDITLFVGYFALFSVRILRCSKTDTCIL